MAILEREPVYVTRESVQRALDVATTRRSATRIDECIAAASRDVDGLTKRVFYPWTGTRYFDWPSRRGGTSYRVWLDQDEMVQVDSVVSGGQPITDFFPGPVNDLPYDKVEIDRGGSGSFVAGDTSQRNVALTGIFCGAALRERDGGALAASLNGSSALLTVTDGSLVGIGSVLRIGTERLQVWDRYVSDTGTTLSGDLAANNGAAAIAVASGAAVHPGEVILVDAERMLVTDVTGNNLAVKRAWDGTVLAAHTTGDTVYAYRLLAVTRGDLGTTAAAHDSAAPIRVHVPPALVSELTMAYALTMLTQGSAAYSNVVGSGENQRESTGRGVRAIEADVARALKRRGRMRSV